MKNPKVVVQPLRETTIDMVMAAKMTRPQVDYTLQNIETERKESCHLIKVRNDTGRSLTGVKQFSLGTGHNTSSLK